jgi:hypothetical protein
VPRSVAPEIALICALQSAGADLLTLAGAIRERLWSERPPRESQLADAAAALAAARAALAAYERVTASPPARSQPG